MTAVPSPATIPALTREILQLKVQLAEERHQRERAETALANCRAQGKRMEVRIRKLLDERSMERRVRRAKYLSPIAKEVGIALTQHYDAQEPPAPEADGTPGYKQVFMPAVAEALGVSPDTVGRAVKSLAAAGAFRYDTKSVRSGAGGIPVNHSYYAPMPDWREHPEQFADVAPPRNHGGKRIAYACPECESTDLQEVRTILRKRTCRSCGHIWEPDPEVGAPYDLNAPDDEDDDPRSPAETPNISPAPQVAAREDTTPTPPAPEPDPTPAPAPTPDPDPRFVGQPWYDPAAPDGPLSQALSWALYCDVDQATLWYQSPRLQTRFASGPDATILTLTSLGPLSAVQFLRWLRERYEGGDYDKLRMVAAVCGIDAERIRPLLQELDGGDESESESESEGES